MSSIILFAGILWGGSYLLARVILAVSRRIKGAA